MGMRLTAEMYASRWPNEGTTAHGFFRVSAVSRDPARFVIPEFLSIMDRILALSWRECQIYNLLILLIFINIPDWK